MPTDVQTLMEMGFSENRAKRALAKTGYKGVQVAMDWCFAHEDDPDVDDPFEEPKGHTLSGATAQPESATAPTDTAAERGDSSSPPAETEGEQVAKSLKCDDCGKILRNVEEAEFHAAKTKHSNFSESTEEKKALTPEEKAQQLAKLQDKIKQKRLEREENEKKEAIQKEKLRRIQGKDVVSAKAKYEEDEIKKIAELRRREKEEDKLARQRVKEQIERDRKERAAKFGKQPSPASSNTAVTPAPAAAAALKPSASKDYSETKIQIRLPSGQALTQTFGAKEQLAAVRLFVEMNRKDDSSPFKLMVSFPRKVFTNEDMEKPLAELGLVPSAVLIVTKAT